MVNKIITKENEKYGYWKVLEPNIINPETTARTYIGKPVFSKCICTNCNETIRYIRNNELKKYLEKPCFKCCINIRAEEARPKKGDRFGKLTVIKDGGVNNQRHYSICQCECGNIIKVMDNKLKTGNNSSCGQCRYSKGEYMIQQVLKNNNIVFKHDIVLEELVSQTGRRLRFDFIIYNEDDSINRFVEFDGNQHKTGMWGGNWSNTETYEVIHERDMIKNQFCIKNNYILIRIPYSKIDNLTLQDIMGEEYRIYE